MASSFKDEMACRTSESELHIYKNSSKKQRTFSEVLTLITCHLKSHQIIWASVLDTICVFEKVEVKQVAITDPKQRSTFLEIPSSDKFSGMKCLLFELG